MTFASYQMHNTHVLCQHGPCWVAAATNNIHCKSGNLENVSELTYTPGIYSPRLKNNTSRLKSSNTH